MADHSAPAPKRQRTLSVPNIPTSPTRVPKLILKADKSRRKSRSPHYTVSTDHETPMTKVQLSTTPTTTHDSRHEGPSPRPLQATLPLSPIGVSINQSTPELIIENAFTSHCIGCSPTHINFGHTPTMHCEFCSKYYCLECASIEPEIYPVLKNSQSFHWFCPLCEGKAIKSITIERDIEKRCAEFLNKMEGRLSTVESTLRQKVDKKDIATLIKHEMKDSQTENIHKLVTSEVCKLGINNTSIEKLVQEEVQKSLDSSKDREERSTNIIVHNLPEPVHTSELEKLDDDSLSVEHLITEHLRVNCSRPSAIQRLGKKSEKPRPLKVCLLSKTDKISILKNTRLLKEAPMPYCNVQLSSDMSRSEREENKLLLAEARRMDEADSSGDWIHLVRGAPGNRRIIKVKRRTKT